jgi:hypothetical protein
MALKRSTARAVAASFAIVIAGGTFAGAAVFHLPILGFGRGLPVGAVAQRFEPAAIVRAPKCRVVVRTRDVDVVVHRPSAPVPPPISSTVPIAATGPVGSTYETTTPARLAPGTTAPARTSTGAPVPTTASTIPVLEPDPEPEHEPTDDVPPPSSGTTTTSTEPNEVAP